MKNIYGKSKFSPQEAKNHVDLLINDFKDHYSKLNYKEESPVLISSGIDPTVRFIGSHISVFKPFLIENNVPSPGVFMRQDCIRTKNISFLFDDSYLPMWGSFFSSIGALSSPNRLNEACEELFIFLNKILNISPENILIRINSSDDDLVNACSQYYDIFEKDTMPNEYYRHKIGLENVHGRNCNIALKNPNDDNFSDIGNIIVLENGKKKIGIETALGSTVMLKQLYGLNHIQDCMPIIELQDINNEAIRRKFEDAIIVSINLFREGLKPFSKDSRSRILKQYVLSLSYFRAKSKISMENLLEIISNFENREFPNSIQHTSKILIDSVQQMETNLLNKEKLTESEIKTKMALKSLI
jgi:hypothetical protein